ncbi:MAG TPA: serine hydrolase domain-containing protein [Rhizomicrobium sp.]|nr:serine hydrolase domain-containing protein [Rhizomicrobium sp.]
MSDLPLDGFCDPRFEAVREAFAANFRERGEPGAAVCVSVSGKPVVDLWGGYANIANTRPWQRDTLVNVFSVGKALCALAAARIVEQGLVGLDEPVAKLWPEFAQAGKDKITLRQLLSHRGGLPAIEKPLPDGAALDWSMMTRALEQQAPWWEPGAAFGYHVNTYGFLIGEIVQRASGKTLGRLIREEVARPLDADIHIGLPREDHARVAEYRWPGQSTMTPPPEGTKGVPLMRWNAYWNPPGISGAHWVNRTEWRLAEVPSTNGHGHARGVARIYAALAKGGAIDGIRTIGRETLKDFTAEHSRGEDQITQHPARFGLGFQLTQPERPLGPNPRSFGHFGAGGSLGFCDPDADVAFGYVTNDMGPRWQNPRNRALMEAVYASL